MAGTDGPPLARPEVGREAAPPLIYDLPAEWRQGKTGQLRRAAFEVIDGDRQAEITVIDLPAAASNVEDVMANVNRWRQQVGLPPAETLDQTDASDLVVDGRTGTYLELKGDRLAIFAVMVPDGDRVWFIKLMGDVTLVDRERERFRSFAESIHFPERARGG
jgi:hypothetical protein